MSKVRIDKWLWAARFYKTRSLAKQAIDGGKVHIDGHRIKASKEVEVGLTLVLRQGWDEKEVLIRALSDKRGPAPVAATLYEETEQSIAKRAEQAEQRRASQQFSERPANKPNTRQRRHIHRFKRAVLDSD
ncbi:RNA-binding S4 domain-containing protein [Agaribacterium haliotis]|uniref:RNA-binding S4 domain-containing protein n=1 Tax=Agaribacterium haliotis TaxID=2013869 RepID=UPI000BB591D9|nr:S4 domain-containing protein [Agaribacterium haliotis]